MGSPDPSRRRSIASRISRRRPDSSVNGSQTVPGAIRPSVNGSRTAPRGPGPSPTDDPTPPTTRRPSPIEARIVRAPPRPRVIDARTAPIGNRRRSDESQTHALGPRPRENGGPPTPFGPARGSNGSPTTRGGRPSGLFGSPVVPRAPRRSSITPRGERAPGITAVHRGPAAYRSIPSAQFIDAPRGPHPRPAGDREAPSVGVTVPIERQRVGIGPGGRRSPRSPPVPGTIPAFGRRGPDRLPVARGPVHPRPRPRPVGSGVESEGPARARGGIGGAHRSPRTFRPRPRPGALRRGPPGARFGGSMAPRGASMARSGPRSSPATTDEVGSGR